MLNNVAPIAIKNTVACAVTNPGCYGQTVTVSFDESQVSTSTIGLINVKCNSDSEFTCDGGAAVVGSGNGSPADHVPAAEARRPAFHGHALVIVRGPVQPGPFSLTVSASGLQPATLDLQGVTPS